MNQWMPLVLGVPFGASPDQVRRVAGGRLVVISGASRGIGADMVRRLVCLGATVVGIARTGADLEELGKSLTPAPGRFHPLPGDLRDLDWAQNTGRLIVDQWGTPAVMISNAGHSIHRTLSQYADRFHDLSRTTGVNYLGAVGLAMPIVEAMRAAGCGHLISVSTTSVDLPLPAWSAYSASKGAYELWLRSVAPELRGDQVAMTSVHMPRVATAMSAPTAGRYLIPELSIAQAADILCYALVHKPRYLIPWWARLSAAVSGGFPSAIQRSWELALSLGVKP
ncbi:MAG: SDR family NAD(P)-dependent oxidoreductase [Propionibacteriaceae bacterium]|nr:SDR family NAD(P)-dependent oxidoreductase [Propionibacteriaceae bacterium]